ncbi:cytosolic endo-beta-N-acetylglucosaminidase 1 [Elaeis guineensis]|uniref:mannosyl-glycoprotein endo-beta-N-acetylglucosaminidase n=1 Tax=Elaeis guineensis var. tenera TaxID=51953 RepID=A0A6I9R6P3_ELAGV|nr:cytosolic endo-beta-N-acetylglucosaminidase 1 [Elaeis guineensis]
MLLGRVRSRRGVLTTLWGLLLPPLRFLRRLLLPPLRLLHRVVAMADKPDPGAPQEERRPWEPPFDPSKPSTPISYPITTLDALESRSYFDSFHFPFNKASVPLPSSAAGVLPARRRLLVCHDFKGGYQDDIWVQGGANPDAYAIWHWYLMDVFVYFSHYLVTLPPPCWINAAHTHGVKVLGTFITEWDEGTAICNTLLSSKTSAQMYAERLTELATALGFDGWLVNMEVNLDLQQIDNLKEFIHHLSLTMHSSVPGSLVIWYDAVTVDGKLDWQNQLNEKNKPFFDLCDGIFVNYTWNEKYPEVSATVAGNRRFDVYMGIDVFGRNTYGGGQWNTNIALDLLKNDDVSAAIFAPGWVYETDQQPDFQTAQNRWWGLVDQSWGRLQSYPKLLPFYSNFDQGHGYHYSIEGLQVADDPWNNISCQGFQPLIHNFTNPSQTNVQAFINFKDASYSGGGNITAKGSLEDDTSFSIMLFFGELPLEDLPVHILYSVILVGNSILGLSLDFSSEINGRRSILIINDVQSRSTVNHWRNKYDEIIYSQVKKTTMEVLADAAWIVCEASVKMSGYILTGIHVVGSNMRRPGMTESATMHSTKLENETVSTDGFSPYCASLGHITIRTSEQSMAFPPADSWITEGQHISWTSLSQETKAVSLKIAWILKSGNTTSFMNYNIYVEKIAKDATSDRIYKVPSYLGIAKVETFYVSDLDVPSGVTSLRFIIQGCGLDGACQELHESPAFVLAVEGQ